MWNWNDICTKYRAYQMAGDYGGMMAILTQIKNHYNLLTNAQALQHLQEHCRSLFPDFNWQLPTNPEAQIDCYDCRGQIMQRYMATEGCPEGWIASPVNASTGVSKNPCHTRNKLSPQFGDVNFYDSNTGRAVGDPTIMRGGSVQSAAAKKIGNFLPKPAARKYSRLRGENPNVMTGKGRFKWPCWHNGKWCRCWKNNSGGINRMCRARGYNVRTSAPMGMNTSGLSKGYPINKGGILENKPLMNGYPINESGILDQKGMAKHDKGYPINSFGTHPKKRK